MGKNNIFTEEDDAILAELGYEVEAKKITTHTPREERIIAGFEEIQKFVEEHNRLPEHGEDKDIFERLYAVRLDQIRELEEAPDLLKSIDVQGLLHSNSKSYVDVTGEELDDNELLARLGIDL